MDFNIEFFKGQLIRGMIKSPGKNLRAEVFAVILAWIENRLAGK